MPIAVNCFRGHNCPPEREWRLLRGTGWVVDIVRILVSVHPGMRLADWNAGCPILYYAGHCAVSPSSRSSSDGKQYECCLPWWVDGSTAVLTHLGHCIVALAMIVMISILHWIIRERKHFTGPRTTTSIDHDSVNNIQQQTTRNSADIQIKQPPG